MPFIIGMVDGTSETARSPRGNYGNPAGPLRVSGIRHVMSILEKTENGVLRDVAVLELSACDHGCYGSPLLAEDAFVAAHRWSQALGARDPAARAIRRKAPFCARPGMRLDEDMSKAIVMLSEIDEVASRLPGRDCAMCGAPTCAAFAEDMVLHRARDADCVHRT
jgi:hypothetical protein